MKLLHIDSSILGAGSLSRRLSAMIVEKCRSEMSNLNVIYRDLAQTPVSPIAGEHFQPAGTGFCQSTPELECEIGAGAELFTEFIEADAYVIGVPMYNWAAPSQFKAWIDRIWMSSRASRMSEKLEIEACNKPMIIASSRAGFYTTGNSSAKLDEQERYVREIFDVFGVSDVRFIRAEGVVLEEAICEAAMTEAMRLIQSV